MRDTSLRAILTVSFLASGCSLLYRTDGFLGRDAGEQSTDAGPDAGRTDGGAGDAGPNDAGPDDAGPPDAGLNDASPGVDAGCADIERDPLHCGECDHACSAPENASPTCSGGSCGFECNAGFDLVVGSCAPRPPPRPIAPMSTATATSRRPTFRWELAPRNDGARVQICADRACTSVITTINTEGDHGRPTSDLPAGVVFWRLYGRNGDDVGHEPSVTWQLYIRSRSAPVDTSWGTVPDVNGDGFADLLRAVDGAVHIHHGTPTGLSATPTTVLTAPPDAGPNFGASVSSAGDVNGDGFVDVAVSASNVTSSTNRVYVFYGGPTGVASMPATTLMVISSSGMSYYNAAGGVGDLNMDGYADLLVQRRGLSFVHMGSAAGAEALPSTTLTNFNAGSMYSTGDFNGDGFNDFIVPGSGPASPTDAGAAAVYLGSEAGVSREPFVILEAPDGPGSFFGSDTDAGDVNGDGYCDILVGTASATSNERVFLYLGSAGAVSADPSSHLYLEAEGCFGHSLASGDFNGDGFDDVVVGENQCFFGPGAVHLFPGGLGGVASPPSVTRTGPLSMTGFGLTVSRFGDFNSDGFDDVVIGNRLSENMATKYVYLGVPTGLSGSPTLTLSPP